MHFILLFLLLFSIVLKLFPPKKPNYMFGYQLGNAKKSVKHWKMANSFAANGMILIYGLTSGLSFLFDYQKYDGDTLLLALIAVGLIALYIIVERRLKRIDEATQDNSSLE